MNRLKLQKGSLIRAASWLFPKVYIFYETYLDECHNKNKLIIILNCVQYGNIRLA